MDVNVQKQCVKVFTAEGVINMQPLLVLTQDLSGVAQQDTLVQGIGDIRDDISTLAKQGTNPDANLSSTQTAAQGAALNSQIARGYIGTPQSGQADTLFEAIANISIDTSTIAKQGTNASATLTATQTAATNAYASAEAAKIGVVDGNDTAVGVAKEIRSEVGTGSDTAAETGTLFAVVKWVKDKVKSIFQLIGSPASGQPSTLFAAIAAGGGGGGDAQESTSQAILAQVNAIANANILVKSLNGVQFASGFTPTGVMDLLYNSMYITSIIDSDLVHIYGQPLLHNANLLTNLTYIELQNVVDSVGKELFRALPQIRVIKLPKITSMYFHETFHSSIELREVYFPKLNSVSTIQNPFFNASKLILLEIGEGITGSFSFINTWNPTEALRSDSSTLVEPGETFANNLEKFLYNVRTHIAALLPDRTGETAWTITLHANVKAAIQADTATANAFSSKNWTIA